VPYVAFIYFIACLDRANVAFAKISMTADLGFSEAVFGFGAGVFFIGYVLLEIPGALIVERWSARVWIARIMITWGVCTVLVGCVKTANQFYLARAFLGVAEGGFFTGMIVYLSHWFPPQDRARAMSGFVMAGPIANVLGALIAALILKIDWFGIPGWRWIFILEGLPAIVFGAVTLFYLTDRPAKAKWLEPEEIRCIEEKLEEERKHKRAIGTMTAWQGMKQRNILLLAGGCAVANLSMFSYMLWLPTNIRNASGLSVTVSTALSGVPFALAVLSIYCVGRSSDRTGKRRLHTIVPLILAGLFFLGSTLPGLPFWAVFLLLCLTGAAAYSWGVSFWIIPSLILGESAAAASVGLINVINAIGSFLGPTVTGVLLTNDYSQKEVVALLATCFFIAAVFVGLVRPKKGQSQL